jgi:fermentation-respiration switch protein FrsA (DUF1100 family)
MIEPSAIRYPLFDKPDISHLLFYPRPESEFLRLNSELIVIPVEKEIVVGARFHGVAKGNPTLLFFHGNGEIAADYEDMGAIYRQLGINFLPVDYRGYGRSTGMPTVTGMMHDSHAIFAYTHAWLVDRGYTGPIVVMGRSLGSASAVDIAYHEGERVAGLIIESGFAFILPLLGLLGIADPELSEDAGPQNDEKIRKIRVPTLIIHAESDQIIPFAEGEELYEASGAAEKKFLAVRGAGHNDIFFRGMQEYLQAIEKFMETIMK